MSKKDRPHGDVIRQIAKRSHVAIAIVDRNCNVIFDTLTMVDDELGQLCDGLQLAPKFATLVRGLIDDGDFDSENATAAVALLGERSFVRVHPVRDSRSRFSLIHESFLVSVEELRNRDELADASRRFDLTQREAEILAHLMHGAKASEIARTLNLAEGTVQNYYKRLLSKTSARNRAAMVAAVLGWKQQAPGNRSAR